MITDKVRPHHLERKALLYVRQSSAHQVLHNREGSALQYAMRDRLTALGWSEIEVIDDDLGRSAAGGVQRAGFERMVGEVCLGKVGAVCAREVSRFARNSRDWQQLIEMCRVVDTVLVDQETIYAPGLEGQPQRITVTGLSAPPRARTGSERYWRSFVDIGRRLGGNFHGRGRTKVCQFWAHAVDDRPWGGPSPPAVAYVFADGRGKDEIAAQLIDYAGILQVDGYGAYKSLAKGVREAGTIRLAFCLAHARRKFVKIYKSTKSPFAQEVIERIAAIYAIEGRVRGTNADVRLAARKSESKPLMEELKSRLTVVLKDISAKSPLAEAIRYTLGHWDGLTVFLTDGRVEVDTDTVERSMRPIGLGRKNSLFSGSEGGAESWASLASVLNTAKLNGIDPQTYLCDVLERIVSGCTKNHQLHELLAWNWKAARDAAGQVAA